MMRHSALQKVRRANTGVVCSGSRMCPECRLKRKKNKKVNNKTIRRLNKLLTTREH